MPTRNNLLGVLAMPMKIAVLCVLAYFPIEARKLLSHLLG